MTALPQDEEESPRRSGKRGLILGILAALVLGGAGFYATYSGLIGGLPAQKADSTDKDRKSAKEEGKEKDSSGGDLADIAFVPLDPLVVSLGPRSASRHLRFTAQLEVAADRQEEVALLRPRVADVLNVFLRAVDPRDLESPWMMEMIRAQMLRRVQLVTGPDRVRDLLIIEFVLN